MSPIYWTRSPKCVIKVDSPSNFGGECFHAVFRTSQCLSIRIDCRMPNTKSAKKRHRQSQVRRTRNRAAKSVLKTQVRKVREAIAAGELDKAADELRTTAKKLDQTAA